MILSKRYAPNSSFHFFSWKNIFTKKKIESPSLQKNEIKKVAILGPLSSPLVKPLSHGFITTLRKYMDEKVTFKMYNVFSNTNLIHPYLDEIIHTPYDLVFTTNALCAENALEVLEKNALSIPLVFSGIHMPEKKVFLKEKHQEGHNITGIFESERDYEKQISLLLALQPASKNILLLCNPSANDSFVGKEYSVIKKIFEGKNVVVKSVFVSAPHEVISKVTPELASCDLVMILRDETVLESINELIKIVETYKKPLFCSEKSSVKAGASFGFGATDFTPGEQEAYMAYQIIKQGIPAKAISLHEQRLSEKILINQQALKRQGIEIDPHTLMLLKYVEPHEQITSV